MRKLIAMVLSLGLLFAMMTNGSTAVYAASSEYDKGYAAGAADAKSDLGDGKKLLEFQVDVAHDRIEVSSDYYKGYLAGYREWKDDTPAETSKPASKPAVSSDGFNTYEHGYADGLDDVKEAIGDGLTAQDIKAEEEVIADALEESVRAGDITEAYAEGYLAGFLAGLEEEGLKTSVSASSAASSSASVSSAASSSTSASAASSSASASSAASSSTAAVTASKPVVAEAPAGTPGKAFSESSYGSYPSVDVTIDSGYATRTKVSTQKANSPESVYVYKAKMIDADMITVWFYNYGVMGSAAGNYVYQLDKDLNVIRSDSLVTGRWVTFSLNPEGSDKQLYSNTEYICLIPQIYYNNPKQGNKPATLGYLYIFAGRQDQAAIDASKASRANINFCWDCGGLGNKICSVCNGGGRIAYWTKDSRGFTVPRNRICDNCKGARRLTCRTCNGDGIL